MIDAEVRALSVRVLDTYRARKWRLATAESCTGGLVAELLTAVPGSSQAFAGAVVAYAGSESEDRKGWGIIEID